jgi:hypothetical protein
MAVTTWDRDRNRRLDLHRLAAWQSPVTVRMATAADLVALERLAGLDSRPLPPGPHLVAERDGRIDAALSLATGGLVADPFRRTAELSDLLRCHAGRLAGGPQPSPSSPLQLRPVPVAT